MAIPNYHLDLVHVDPKINATQALEASQARVSAAARDARSAPRLPIHVVVWTSEEAAAIEAEHGPTALKVLYHEARAQLQNAGYRNESTKTPWGISITAGLTSHLE